MNAPVLHSKVLDVLGSEIANMRYAAGDVLRIADLNERFGVSRTVVREAIRILESLGMVSARRKVGVTIQPESAWAVLNPRVISWRLEGEGRSSQLLSLTQLRVALEPIAARLAAQTARESGDELLRLAARLRELGERGRGDTVEYLNVDVQFHSLLMTCGENEMFGALAGPISEVLAGRTRLGLTPDFPEPQSLDDHEAVARAVADGDGIRAEQHARAVVENVWAEVMGEREPNAPTST